MSGLRQVGAVTLLVGSLAVTSAGLASAAAERTPPAPQAGAGDWTEIDHAHPAGQESHLRDAWSDGSDVWAAGHRTYVVGGATETRTWVQRCSGDGGTCALENTLDVEASPANTSLESVTGVSATDVWIAGSAKQPFGQIGPLAEHFDGDTWSIVPTPVDFGDLWGISAASTNDVWAVGDDRRVGSARALVLHWDGTSWAEDPVELEGCGGGLQLFDVDATGRKPLAVGDCYPLHGDGRPVILGRDADGWSEYPTKGTHLRNADLRTVSWTGRVAWASGGTRLGHGRTARLQHGTWSQVSVPRHMGVQTGFAGPNGRDVWAVGSRLLHLRSMHWDGKAWTRVDDPGFGWLEGVTLAAGGRPWAVGTSYAQVSLIQRYDGPL